MMHIEPVTCYAKLLIKFKVFHFNYKLTSTGKCIFLDRIIYSDETNSRVVFCG